MTPTEIEKLQIEKLKLEIRKLKIEYAETKLRAFMNYVYMQKMGRDLAQDNPSSHRIIDLIFEEYEEFINAWDRNC